ncbi:hypothetical protein PtB15_1B377 [Puccinia triticina]|nr:hypothetical protein PtB15_1B377 [Puccinia triticina]
MSMFGLEPKPTMRGLSGGQKPSNYLDCESLAALIESLNTFEGGVLVITHNREFSESICSEVWAMRHGYLEASGHTWTEGQGSGPKIDKAKDKEEEHFDASLWNKIEAPKKVQKVTSKEERKKKKERMACQKAGLGSHEEGVKSLLPPHASSLIATSPC